MVLACGFCARIAASLEVPVREGLLEGLRVPQGGLHGTPDSVKHAQNGQILRYYVLSGRKSARAASVSEFPASASDAAKETFTALCDVSAGHRSDERRFRDVECLERVVRTSPPDNKLRGIGLEPAGTLTSLCHNAVKAH